MHNSESGTQQYSAEELHQIRTILSSAKNHIFQNARLHTQYTHEETIAASQLFRQLCVATDSTASEEDAENSNLSEEQKKARNQIILGNMRLVLHFIRKYSRDNQYLEDTIQEGMLGLIRAAEKFDPKKERAFSTYAAYWIQRMMSRSISDSLIRIPVYLTVAITEFNKLESEPDSQTELPQTTLALIQQAFKMLSLENIDANGDQGIPLTETIPDETDFFEPVAQLWGEDDIQDVLEEVVTSKEEIIIKLFYGFGKYEPHSLKEIATRFNHHPERIRQILRAARKKIYSYYQKQGLSKYRKLYETI